MKAAKLIGGAGTGKTHRLMDTLDKILSRIGDPLLVGYVSFTRAARAEAVNRASDRFSVPPTRLERKGWFRTLHSCCKRLLGVGDELLANDADARRWLAEALGEEVDHLEADTVEGYARAKSDAEVSLQLWHTARNRLASLESVYAEAYACQPSLPDLGYVEWIVKRYEEAKQDDDRVDFTDMLLRVAGWRCWTEGPEQSEPDGEPPDVVAWIHDEAQDASKLSFAVFHRLIHAPSVEWCYIAGDPYQALYGWAGGDHHQFLDFAADKSEIMRQSWRCPAPILEAGEEILRDCTDYFDRKIRPADHEGEILRRHLEEFPDELDPRDDWLVLTRTNYWAHRLQAILDDHGTPWRPVRGNGGWQPTKRTRAIQTLRAMQEGRPIRPLDWREVVGQIPAKGRLVRGARKQWLEGFTKEDLRTWPEAQPDEWDALGVTDEYAAKIKSGAWQEDVPGAASYGAAVQQYGQAAVDKPGIQVGTIHSVKGAEADNVCMLTTVSTPIMRALSIPTQADAEQRVWYVAATRARERLVVLEDPRATYRKGLPI